MSDNETVKQCKHGVYTDKDCPTCMLPVRGQILSMASRHTLGDRDVEYGSPVDNLTDIADLWTAYLKGKYGIAAPAMTAEDVAWFNVMQKMARTFTGQVKHDTYEDAAAYSAIAGECAEALSE